MSNQDSIIDPILSYDDHMTIISSTPASQIMKLWSDIEANTMLSDDEREALHAELCAAARR